MDWSIILIFALAPFGLAQPGFAQEYIQSSSPLPDGRVVTTTSVPGQSSQTVIGIGSTMPMVSSYPHGGYPQGGYSQGGYPQGGYPQGQAVIGPVGAASAAVPPRQASAQYHWNTAGVWQPMPSAGLSVQSFSPGGPVTGQTGSGGEIANQVPTLGVPQRYPTHLGFSGSPLQPPQPFLPGATAGTGLAIPQPQQSPLIQFRNLPPGTYVGQGIVGQPKAYVDGQPLRNLVRYLSIF